MCCNIFVLICYFYIRWWHILTYPHAHSLSIECKIYHQVNVIIVSNHLNCWCARYNCCRYCCCCAPSIQHTFIHLSSFICMRYNNNSGSDGSSSTDSNYSRWIRRSCIKTKQNKNDEKPIKCVRLNPAKPVLILVTFNRWRPPQFVSDCIYADISCISFKFVSLLLTRSFVVRKSKCS